MSDHPALFVREMHVTWRDTFTISHTVPYRDFLAGARERLSGLPMALGDSFTPRRQQPRLLWMAERVSKGVAGIGHPNLLRVQFEPLEIAPLPHSIATQMRDPARIPAQMILEAGAEADADGTWIHIDPLLVLHRARAGVMTYHTRFALPDPGYSPREAIERVRMGIGTGLVRVPTTWRAALPDDLTGWPIAQVVDSGGGLYLLVGSPRDLTQSAIAAHLASPPASGRRRRRPVLEAVIPPRPTGSTSVVLTETDPLPDADYDAFIDVYGPELRGIGALDAFYTERAPWVVEQELHQNLSSDAEAALYLLGNSELILFNRDGRQVLQDMRDRHHLPDLDHAAIYWANHYSILMDWVYIQDAILRTYIQRLDAMASSPEPQRRDLIAVLQGALSDLVPYSEGITPFSTRINFLEAASRFHKIDNLTERFERKQALLLSYTAEYHDFRDARASEFLNQLAGVLAAFELAALLTAGLGLTLTEQPLEFIGVVAGSVLLVYVVIAVLLRAARR